MFIVGLTGGIATGKSTVGSMIKEYGIPVLDADYYARKVVEPGRRAWKGIRAEFGDSVFDERGHLDREALAEIIFSDREKRRRLNQITHPEIYKEMAWAAFASFLRGHAFVVMDLPLLFETGVMLGYLYKVIVVTCPEEMQVSRLVGRSGGGGDASEARARRRMAAQMPQDEKAARANFVIDNRGSLQETRAQVDAIVRLLRSSRRHWRLRAIIASAVVAILTALLHLASTR